MEMHGRRRQSRCGQHLLLAKSLQTAGTFPVKEYSNTRVGLVIVPFEHFSFLRLSSPLEAFVEKLREMGLTSREWPFLAPGIYAILNANIERAGEEKEKLKQLPAIVLNMSRKMATGIRYACLNKRETVVCPKWSELTIGMLLTFSPFLIRKMADANDVTQSIRATREKLRLLGFTNDDGPFLAEGTREAAIKTVAKDLQVSKDKASEILDYFRWVGFEILD
jgi:hypothetical protein